MTKPQLTFALPLLLLLLAASHAVSGCWQRRRGDDSGAVASSPTEGRAIRVSGRIELNPRVVLPTNARLVVKLQDISLADAPSKLLASKTFESIDTTFNANGNIPFVIEATVPTTTPFGPTSVAVSGSIRGDGVSYFTDTSYFVDLKSGTFEYKEIVVTLVKYP